MPCQVICKRGDQWWPIGQDESPRYLDGMLLRVAPITDWSLGREADPETSESRPFYILTVLDADVEQMKAVIEQMEDEREHIGPRRRSWRFNTKSLPANIRRRLVETGRCDVTMDQIRRHVRHSRTGEML